VNVEGAFACGGVGVGVDGGVLSECGTGHRAPRLGAACALGECRRGKARFLSMFAMGWEKKVQFSSMFAKGRWGFLRCLPRFCDFRHRGMGWDRAGRFDAEDGRTRSIRRGWTGGIGMRLSPDGGCGWLV
jgi:hypothetical protein